MTQDKENRIRPERIHPVGFWAQNQKSLEKHDPLQPKWVVVPVKPDQARRVHWMTFYNGNLFTYLLFFLMVNYSF